MHAGVLGKLGVECRGHHFSLPDDYRVAAFSGEDFDAGADAGDLWGRE